ncbi:OmpA/MotB family protein [Hwanghaeella sp.]|uniref:OmpA/MotB family protein n=1 Tax=Hwanghaeella sp. TaxID=2605943 RepID=UPI003CCB964F
MPHRRRRSDAVQENEDDWLVTYADAITLLMAFFVMLISFSKIDLVRFEEVQAGIKGEVGKKEQAEVKEVLPIFNMHSKVQAIVDTTAELPPGDVQVGFDDEGIVIDFVVASFFKPRSLEMTDPAKLILRQIRYELQEPPYDAYFVDVEGHTDDVPISTPEFPSNWELSSLQAASVVRHLIEEGMDPSRMQAAGYADTRPKLRATDIAGEPIPENRRQNRRIAIRLHP